MGDLQDSRLMGWKTIGSFVGRDARTARRWEQERGLPVHRVPGGGSASVWADRDELRYWLTNDASGPATPPAALPKAPRRVSRSWIMAATALAVAAASLVVWNVPSGVASKVGEPTIAPYGNDQAANGAYRAANYAMNMRSVTGLSDAVRQFSALAEAHPSNAAAFVGLAETNLLLREFDSLPQETAYRRAASAARRALQIDPRSPGGLRSLAFITYWSDGDRTEALDLFRRAIAEDPANAQSYHWYGTALFGDGRFTESLAALERARVLNPGSSAIASDEAYVRYLAGQRSAGIASLKRITTIDPSFSGAHTWLANIDLAERDDAGFIREASISADLRRDAVRASEIAAAASAFRTGGHDAMLASLTASAERAFEQGGGRALAIAQMTAIANKRETTLKWLARSDDICESEIKSIRAYPAFAAYRGDVAFKRYFDPR